MMKSKKGDVVWSNILRVMAGAVVFIVVLFFIYNLFDDGYGKSIGECSFFMTNVNGKPTYFNKELNSPSNTFIETIEKFCPSKNVEIEEDSVSELAYLADTCWKKMGSGEDFFGANVENMNLCVSCGFAEVTKDIDNFNERFVSELSRDKYQDLKGEDSEMKSLNEALLFDENILPKSLDSGTVYNVIFFAYKGESETPFMTWISKNIVSKVSEGGNWILSSSKTQGVTGVYLYEVENSNELNFNKQTSISDAEKTKIGCDTMIISDDTYN